MEEAEKTLYPNLYAERKQRGLVYGLKNAIGSTERKNRRALRKQKLEQRVSLALVHGDPPTGTDNKRKNGFEQQGQQQSAELGYDTSGNPTATRESLKSRLENRRRTLPTFMTIDRESSFKNPHTALAQQLDEAIASAIGDPSSVGLSSLSVQPQEQCPKATDIHGCAEALAPTRFTRNDVIRGDFDVKVDENVLTRPFTACESLQQLHIGEVNFCSRPRTRYTRREVSRPIAKLQQLFTTVPSITGGSCALQESQSMPGLHTVQPFPNHSPSSSSSQEPATSPKESTPVSIALKNRLIRGPSISQLAQAASPTSVATATASAAKSEERPPHEHDEANPMFFITEVDAKVPPLLHQHFPTCLAQGAVSLYALEQFDQAICWFQKALAVVRSTADRPSTTSGLVVTVTDPADNNKCMLVPPDEHSRAALEALCLHQMGLAYKEAKQLDLATQMQKKCIKWAKHAQDQLLQARGHKALGVCFFEINNFKSALHHQRKALALATCSPVVLATNQSQQLAGAGTGQVANLYQHPLHKARAFNNCNAKGMMPSTSVIATGPPSSRTSSTTSLAIKNTRHDLELEARIYANFGNLASGQSRLLDAFAFYDMDLKISSRLRSCIGMSRAHRNLSILYGKMRQQVKQHAHLTRAKHIALQAFEKDVATAPFKVTGNVYLQITRWNQQVAKQVHHALLAAFQQFRLQLDAKAQQQQLERDDDAVIAAAAKKTQDVVSTSTQLTKVDVHLYTPNQDPSIDPPQLQDQGDPDKSLDFDRDQDGACCQDDDIDDQYHSDELAKLVANMSAEINGGVAGSKGSVH